MEKRDLTKELQNLHEQLNHLLLVSPVVIFTSKLEFPYPPTFISGNVVDPTGYEAREFLEDPSFWMKKTHPDDLPYCLVEIGRLFVDDLVKFEYRFLHKDGTYRWFSEGMMVVNDDNGQPEQIFGCLQDISRWREADEVIRKNEERYRALAEAAHDYIFVINRQDIVEYVNNYAANAIHIPVAEIVGKPRSLLFPSEVSDIQYKAILGVLDTGTPHYHEDYIPIGKQKIWLGTWLVPMRDKEGQNISVMGVSRDITDRIKSQEELQSAFEQEKELSDLRSRIVSTISHEFGTPLTTILSSAELLEHYGHQWTDARKLEHYQRIQEAAKRMNSMINRVVEIQRMVHKKEVSAPSQFELIDFCREIIEEMEFASESHGRIKFTYNLPRVSACMDKRLLREALGNLISNALKFSPPSDPVIIKLESKEGKVSISIIDKGIGIPDKDLPGLYEPFQRGSNAEKISGKGLGLAIVKNSVELMGGEIRVESTQGYGSIFILSLPLHQGNPDGNSACEDGKS
jgi:PAS domain S-box-containing protein